MSKQNALTIAPPYPVEQAIKRLAADLRTARLRRNLTIENVARKIGTGPRAVMDAEKGKPSTAFVVYAGLLWTYGLLDQMDTVADPARDEAGQMLASADERSRAREKGKLDDDF